jgi:hypothetical protein
MRLISKSAATTTAMFSASGSEKSISIKDTAPLYMADPMLLNIKTPL